MNRRGLWRLGAALSFVVLVGMVGPARADNVPTTTYSGRAFALRVVTPLSPTPIYVSDTGEIPAQGDVRDAHLLAAGPVGPVERVEALHAAVVAPPGGSSSHAEASAASVVISSGENRITADLLMSEVDATCQKGKATAKGNSSIVGLVVNGQEINGSATPNTTISLGDAGQVVVNEQMSNTNHGNFAEMTVNALHVTLDGFDVIVSSAHANIRCQTKGCTPRDFVTGGGRIQTQSGSKATFGVAGGIKNGSPWGHLVYIDHGTGLKVAHSTVLIYTIPSSDGQHSRRIQGTATADGSPVNFTVDVTDNGEPGRQDTFRLQLTGGTMYDSGTQRLVGGNIQLHGTCPA